jgi:hypothetical protein
MGENPIGCIPYLYQIRKIILLGSNQAISDNEPFSNIDDTNGRF